MRIAVIGASGFLGRNLVRTLLSRGHIVTAVSRKEPDDYCMISNAKLKYLILDGFQAFQGGINDACEGADVIIILFHSSAGGSPRDSRSLDVNSMSSSFSYVYEVIMAASFHGCHLIYISSAGAIYREYSISCPPSEHSPLAPRTPYGIEKVGIESLISSMAHIYSVHSTIVRLTNPYGPWQLVRSGQGVIGHWLKSLCEGQPLKIYGSGSTIRNYIYVDDVCDAILNLMPRSTQVLRTFNVGGYLASLSMLYGTIAKCSASLGIGIPPPLHIECDDLYDCIHVDSSLYCATYGPLAIVTLEDGLLRSMRWALDYYLK